MKISDLRIGQSNADIEAEVIDITEPREFDRFGRNIRVATATIQDSSGNIKMSLWNQDIDKVKIGSKIKVTNGFVKEFQGEKQFTAGKFGKIEVLEGEEKLNEEAKKQDGQEQEKQEVEIEEQETKEPEKVDELEGQEESGEEEGLESEEF